MAADIKPFIEDAKKLEKTTGIPASITLAQIMLESSGSNKGGLSGLAVNGKNLFGVKGVGSGGSIMQATTEFINGMPRTIMASFKKYTSYYDSMVDHAKVLSLPRYQTYLKEAKTVDEFAAGIQKGGYATDPNYSNKLVSIIKQNNLHQYDSGKINFVGSGGSTGDSGEKKEESKTGNNPSIVSKLYLQIMRSVFIVGLFILLIIFFMKAFPAVGDVATSAVPQARIAKTVLKGAKK